MYQTKVVLGTGLAAAALCFGSANADVDTAEQIDSNKQTLRVWQVDYSGKPPFKRSLVAAPTIDVARLESLGVVETRRLRTVDFSSRPPFRRRYQDVPILDAASLETEPVANERPIRRSVGFKRRHR